MFTNRVGSCRARIYKHEVFHTVRALGSELARAVSKDQELVNPGTARANPAGKQFIICLDQLRGKFSENTLIFSRKFFDDYFFTDLPNNVFHSFLISLEFRNSLSIPENFPTKIFCDVFFEVFPMFPS